MVVYDLKVFRAELHDRSPGREAGIYEIYTSISLPRGLFDIFDKETCRANSVASRVEWNDRFEFSSDPSFCIKFRVMEDIPHRIDPCIGTASIRVDKLLNYCRSHEEYVLNLGDPKTKGEVGTIVVRLAEHTTGSPSAVSALQDMKALVPGTQVALMGEFVAGVASAQKLPAVRPTEINEISSEETDGLEILGSLFSKLEKLKLASESSKLQRFVDVMDEASKIHPYAEGAWIVVSVVYKIYQKKVKMEKDVLGLIQDMDESLSFVDDIEPLKHRLRSFVDTIQKVLSTIRECTKIVHEYLDSNTAGRTWKAFADAAQISGFKARLKELSAKLDRSVNVHMALGVFRVEGKQDATNAKLDKIAQSNDSNLAKEVRRPPIINPPPPSEIFTGREEYIGKMEESFDFSKSSVELGKRRQFVLYGTGGMGKTQVALKLIDRNYHKFTVRYMIDASTKDSITSSFVAIATDIGLEGADINRTLQWFSQREDDWLLFYDDAGAFVSSFIPQSRHGNIIVTTRNADLMTLASKSFIEVSTLEEDSATLLLLLSSQLEVTDENKVIAKKIVQEFGYLALAVVQTGSYIATRRLSLNEYYAMYPQDRVSLLSKPLGPDVQYGPGQPVFMTWDDNFADLSEHARTFFNICVFLYREGLSEEIFQRAVTSPNASSTLASRSSGKAHDGSEVASAMLQDLIRHLRKSEEGWSKTAFIDLIHELRCYSLVQYSSNGVFKMHPLVHQWARDRMTPDLRATYHSDALILLFLSMSSLKNSGPSEVTPVTESRNVGRFDSKKTRR